MKFSTLMGTIPSLALENWENPCLNSKVGLSQGEKRPHPLGHEVDSFIQCCRLDLL